MSGRPWDKRPDEPAAAYALLCRYRDLGQGRTLSEYARTLGVKRGRLQALADKYAWSHRVDQYDAHLVALRAKAGEKAAALQMREETRAVAYLARAAKIVAKDFLVDVKRRKAQNQPLKMSPSAVVLLVSESTKLARLVRGEATEVTAVAGARERLADKIERMAEAFRRADARKDVPNT
jgi:hypothetical protein